jgi:hypothetical protein
MVHLPEMSPTTAVLNELVNKSGGSFIWASTLVNFVDDGLPHEKLRSALKTHASSNATFDRRLWNYR